MNRYPRFVTVDLGTTTRETQSGADGDGGNTAETIAAAAAAAAGLPPGVGVTIANILKGKQGKSSGNPSIDAYCGLVPTFPLGVPLGGSQGNKVKAYAACLARWHEGNDPLYEGENVKCDGDARIYMYSQGKKRWFPNEAMWDKYGRKKPRVIACSVLAAIPTGADVDSNTTTAQAPPSTGDLSSGGWGTGNMGTGGGLGTGVDPTKYPDIPAEKFWGIEKPAAYFVYGGLGVAATIATIWGLKKFVFKK